MHVRFFCLDFLKGYDLLISQFLCGCLWTGRLLLFELKEQSEEADTDSFQCATHISWAYTILLSHDCHSVHMYEGHFPNDPSVAGGGIQFSDDQEGECIIDSWLFVSFHMSFLLCSLLLLFDWYWHYSYLQSVIVEFFTISYMYCFIYHSQWLS